MACVVEKSMSEKMTEQFEVFNKENNERVANVMLNGYNIERGAAGGLFGAMRSFKVLDGDLTDSWSTRQSLRIRNQHGEETTVRIAALPVDEESYGLIEFI